MSHPETNLAATQAPGGSPPVLRVEDLKIHFPFSRGSWWKPQRGFIRAVDGISFEVADGETLGLVGESGCGKSTTARGIVNLLRPTAGKVYLDGKRIDHLNDHQMRVHRRKVQMIFQDPFASLNPRMTVGRIIAEPLEVYDLYDRHQRRYEVMRLLELVGLNPRFLNRYPHEFSGGQRQRIGIARALAVQPKLIVCDEAVSALDVSIQAQVINLLMDLQQELGLSYVFIAHDLAVMRHIAHRVGVMYLGRIVELADVDQLYENPQHPYTQALLSAAPAPDPQVQRGRQRVLLEGEVPSPDREYPGCPFVDRCPLAEELCRQQVPKLAGSSHQVSCLKVEVT
ncbi:MAG: oligopeptide/dipeptide ABC transporter ATP-binding protein [Pirellulaceae bacterium]